MKKFTSLLTMAFIAVLSLTFTSCDEDANVAYYLDGTWRGKMYVQYSANGQTYTSTYSVISFDAGYDSGSGVWIDYYGNSHWGRNYVANHIRWKVRDRNIYVHFIEENSDVVIYNYSLNDTYFSGEVDAGDSYATFRLTKDYDDNWNDVVWGYSTVSSQPVSGAVTKSRSSVDSSQVIRTFVKE